MEVTLYFLPLHRQAVAGEQALALHLQDTLEMDWTVAREAVAVSVAQAVVVTPPAHRLHKVTMAVLQ